MTIGVDLGGTNIRAGIKIEHSIINRLQTVLENKHSLDHTLGQLIDLIKPLVQPAVRGIGVAVPSVVDNIQGVVYNVVNIPSWERVELKNILEKKFAVPVCIDNDANCFTVGEYLFGNTKPCSYMVGLVIGTGLGTGIMVDGKIFAGSNSGAGEIGYLPYRDKDFEFYCSSSFFQECYNTTAHAVYEQALLSDGKAIAIWKEFGVHLGNAVKAVVYTYDPEIIVFGGSIAKAYSFFEKSMKQVLMDFHFPESIKKLQLVRSTNENITLLGAGALVEEYLS
jgi:glucokinase